jgi:hypothetical protein
MGTEAALTAHHNALWGGDHSNDEIAYDLWRF